jgi:hypothetical protein
MQRPSRSTRSTTHPLEPTWRAAVCSSLLCAPQDFDAALVLLPSSVKAMLCKGQVLQELGKPAVSGSSNGLQSQPPCVFAPLA